MNKTVWKTIAIVSLLINIIFISLSFVGVSEFNKAVDNENSCYYDICDVDNENSPSYSYNYDEFYEICTCYNEYNEIIDETFLG